MINIDPNTMKQIAETNQQEQMFVKLNESAPKDIEDNYPRVADLTRRVNQS